jgi:general secretion pathway protein A
MWGNKVNETFYGRFYGFNQPPFHITPDPAMLFATDTHRQALAALEYGIAAGKGFIVLIGEVGVGKTTLLRACVDHIGGNNAKVIYLFDPVLTVAELYRTLLEELGVDLRTRSVAKGLRELQKRLLAAHEKGIRVVIAVDEAQNMPEQTLECLRMLSNLETSTTKLMQIILVGQPELDAVLMKHSLRQLAQRIAVRAGLQALTRRESLQYIQHRIERAGRHSDRPLFSRAALWYITSVARGIPRRLNICCDNALINGFGHGAERITLRIAMEACRPMRRPKFRFATVAAGLAAIAICAAFGIRLNNGFSGKSRAVELESNSVQRNLGPRVSIAPRVMATRDQVAASSTAIAPSEANANPSKDQERNTNSLAVAAEAAPSAPAATALPAERSPEPEQLLSRGLWHVRYGDTLLEICRVTYGTCKPSDLRALLARNPQIGQSMKIQVGDRIDLPQRPQTDTAARQIE